MSASLADSADRLVVRHRTDSLRRAWRIGVGQAGRPTRQVRLATGRVRPTADCQPDIRFSHAPPN